MTNVEKILQIAKDEVGYLEKASNAYLDDKTANAGSGNYTKYWRDLSPTLNGQAWCLCFACWCVNQALGQQNALNSLYMSSWTFYTPTSASYFQKHNAWGTTPAPGAFIFFKNDTRICHVGIVYNVDSNYVYTYEGNTSSSSGVITNGGSVCAKKYALSNTRIAGYGYPLYMSRPVASSSTKTTESTTKTTENISVGVDLSKYNTISDYKKMKEAGVNFAFLKIIGKDRVKDSAFETHYKGCLNAGIKIEGAYIYTYSKTVDDAKKDANAVISALNERSPIVVYDVEDKSLIGLNSGLIDIIDAFKEIVEAKGCDFVLYTGLSFYNDYIKPYLNGRKYPLWISRYPKGSAGGVYLPQYKPDVDNLKYWQYSDSCASLPGTNGNIDMNVKYLDAKVQNKGADTTKTLTAETPVMIMVQVMARPTLNLRSQPNTSSAVLQKIPFGMYIPVCGDLGTWYRVQNPAGYVSKDYVRIAHGKVTAEKLNFRSSADKTIDTNKIGILFKDEEVIICSAAGEWYYVLTGDKGCGFVSSKYIELI